MADRPWQIRPRSQDIGCKFYFRAVDHWYSQLTRSQKLHAHGDLQDTYVQAEFQQISEAIEYEKAHEAHGYIELFTHAPSFRRVVLCCAIQASIQMTGVSAIQYYSPTIYKLVGIGTGQALKYQGISSALGLLGEACCMLTVDKIGRRWTLIGFNLLNMCTFIGATAIIGYYPLTGAAASVPTSAAYAFIAMTILYNFSFSWGCGPLSWVSLASGEHLTSTTVCWGCSSTDCNTC